jgi:hypothetical protein
MAPGSRRSGCLEPFSSHARSLDPRVQTATPTRSFSQSHEPRACACVLCAELCMVSDHTVRSTALDGPRQCSTFSNPLYLLVTCDRSNLPNAWKLQTRHCATLPLSIQLGVPKFLGPASVLSALSHVNLSIAQVLFVTVAVAVKATQVTQQHGYIINRSSRRRQTSAAQTRRQPPWQLASDLQRFRPGHHHPYTHYPNLPSI